MADRLVCRDCHRVLEAGRDADYAVTSDMPLRERLLEANVPVISLRGRTKLEITEP